MSFKLAVERFNGRLTEADRALISIILGDPLQVVFQSAQELANQAGVHASTVVRLARKLGFDGFPGLRKALQSETKVAFGPGERVRRRLSKADESPSLSMLIHTEIAAIEAIEETISQAEIDNAANILAGAKKIFIVGRGSAAPLGVHLERRLRRWGFQVSLSLNMQARDLAASLIGMGRDDALISFAFQSPNSLHAGYSALLKYSRTVGAKSIVISDSLGPTLRPNPDALLSVSRPDEAELSMRTAPLVVCEALAITLAHMSPERAVGSSEALEKLRAAFRGEEE
jgi:DNA-binding MurR/RpiR family transcriptional regulator